MKVFQINSVLNGSTGKIARGIYEIAKQNGTEGRIAYSRGPVIENPDFIKFGSAFGVYLHGFLARIFDSSGLHSRFATRKLIKEIDKFNPDIIHLHNLHGYYLNYKALLRYIKTKKIKTVWTLHDCWGFTGHCAYFDMAGCDKWKDCCYKCPNKQAYPQSLVFDNSKKNHKIKKELLGDLDLLTVVAPSKWLAETAKQSFLSKFDIQVIYNGINLDLFKPTPSNFKEKHNLKDKKIILGVAGVWEPRKGFDDFIQLRKQLDDNYVIVLVGLSAEQISLLPEGIIGITRTESPEELAGIYTQADVFVNPTKEETMGLVNIEALACGTPVITYNTGGSPECIDETCGAVVPKGDVSKLTEKVTDESFLNTFTEKNCIAFSKNFCESLKYEEYIDLYKNLTKTNKSGV